MTNMAAMPIYGKNLNKSSSIKPIDRWPWNFVCSIVYASTTKVVEIITLGWPWHILCQGQIWWHRLLYGKKWKLLFFFGNYCSLGSQSCLKHLTQWVNEVEWVSVVKVILWPWSKVTQISKLKAWLYTQVSNSGPLGPLVMPCHKKWRGIMLYPPNFWVSVHPSVCRSLHLSVSGWTFVSAP